MRSARCLVSHRCRGGILVPRAGSAPSDCRSCFPAQPFGSPYISLPGSSSQDTIRMNCGPAGVSTRPRDESGWPLSSIQGAGSPLFSQRTWRDTRASWAPTTRGRAEERRGAGGLGAGTCAVLAPLDAGDGEPGDPDRGPGAALRPGAASGNESLKGEHHLSVSRRAYRQTRSELLWVESRSESRRRIDPDDPG